MSTVKGIGSFGSTALLVSSMTVRKRFELLIRL